MLKQCVWFVIIFLPIFYLAQESNELIHTQFFYTDGTVSSEGSMLKGQPQGLWKSYYTDGKIKSVAQWENGKREGLTIFLTSDSLLIKTIEYSNDLKNGYVIEYDSLENVLYKLPYKNDTLHGVAHYYYPNGTVKEEVVFVNGVKQGVKHVYDEYDGRLIEIVRFENDSVSSVSAINQLNVNNQKHGYWQETNEQGKLVREGSFIDGKEHGTFRVYDKYGKVVLLENYQLGKLVDKANFTSLYIQTKYHDNGKLHIQGPLKDGLKTGTHAIYDTLGNYLYSEVYRNDTLTSKGKMNSLGEYDSLWLYYYSNGLLKGSGEYVKGNKQGKWKFYYPNGKLIQEGNYREDLPHGNWTWYYANGQLKAEEIYYRGKLQGDQYEYDSLGKILTKGQYIDDVKDGEWFYDVGDHKEIGRYLMGRREGEWIYYYDDKTIVFKGKFKDDLPVGKHKEWYGNGKLKEIRRYKSNGKPHGRWIKYTNDGKIEHRLYYKNGNLVNIDGDSVRKN